LKKKKKKKKEEEDKLNKIKVQEIIDHMKLNNMIIDENNIENWNKNEVIYWLNENGFNYCLHLFYKYDIDGDILIYDIIENQLLMTNQLGINDMHVGKLKRLVQTILDRKKQEMNDKNKEKAKEKDDEIKIMKQQIDQLKSESKILESDKKKN